jgi:glycyl-tRNA synthetase beta chain
VKSEVDKLAAANNLSVIDDEALFDEVTGLVEWPVPLFGTFDKKFLELPKEVLISEMKVHQRYFALQDKSGALSNHFIAVANMITADGGKKIVEGNARVLRARLSDGEFYWEQDRKKPLSDWAKGLADVVFHAKVGMMSEKVSRIEKLSVAIAKEVGFKDEKLVQQAARLCKADLTSGMVGEFPELQGIMGRYYALEQNEKPEIADAIRDHYKPVGAADSLPESDLAAIIAIADKLDSITSLFAAGEKPTGSKDPFALRRAALGVLRILLHKKWNLDLATLNAAGDVSDFFRDRLKQTLRDEGVRHDVIEAALNSEEAGFNPLLIATRAHDLEGWLKKDGVESLAAIKRALNILAAEEKKAKASFQFAAAQKTSFAKPAEQQLLASLQQKVVSLDALSKLAAPINTFFNDVMVTEEGHREARLSLLAGVRDAANQIADFSKIEG